MPRYEPAARRASARFRHSRRARACDAVRKGLAPRGGPPGDPARGDTAVIDTLRLTAEEANGLLARGEVSSRAVRRLPGGDRRARRGAPLLPAAVRRRGRGIPIALKDVIGTKGVETTAGSKILAGYVPVYDSTVAARCKARGLPLLGKTNTDEFAMGSSTENSAYGPSRNPWDPDARPWRVGRAARRPPSPPAWRRGRSAPIPAARSSSLPRSAATSACGPTYGTVSRYGIVAFASSLDQVGPVTKTVRDCALLYSVIAGRDPCRLDDRRRARRSSSPSAADLKGLRIGVPVEMLNEAGGSSRASRRGRAHDRALRGARRRGGGVLAAALGRVRAALLLPDRPRRGLVEPRPLRRRPLRLPRRRRAT